MNRGRIIQKLIEQGSDELVRALYDRLRSDRVVSAEKECRGGESLCAPTWRDLAARAVGERILTSEEGISLWDETRERFRHAAAERPPANSRDAHGDGTAARAC